MSQETAALEFARTKPARARLHEEQTRESRDWGDVNTQNAFGSDSFLGKTPELAKLGKVKNIHGRVLLH